MWLSKIMITCSVLGAVGTTAEIFMTPEQKKGISKIVDNVWVWLATMKEASLEKRLKAPWIFATALLLPTIVQLYLLFLPTEYGEMTFRERVWDTLPFVFGIIATLVFGVSTFLSLEKWLKRQSLWKRICVIILAIIVFLFLMGKSYQYLTFDPAADYEGEAVNDLRFVFLFCLTVITIVSYFLLAGAPFLFAYAVAGLLTAAEYTFAKFANFPKGSPFAFCAMVGVIGTMLRLLGY